MIHVLWSVYEEMPLLPQMMKAAQEAIPGDSLSVYVDGAYPYYPTDHELSKDGTREFCEQTGILVSAFATEIDKRNAGLEVIHSLASEDDWILVLDGDEELMSLSLPSSEIGAIRLTYDSDNAARDRARLYRWHPDLSFRGRHFTLYRGGEMFASLSDGELCGHGIHHNIRPRERMARKHETDRHTLRIEKGQPR